ncbi:unnamed protein product [Effrenium voratum]|nr:unnamed protein product [Effrenium voratum]
MVEQKFKVPSDLAQQVAALNGRSLGARSFRDEYWDNEAWRLCTQDCWLRRRDGAFELKRPASGGSERRRSGGETAEFQEITEEAELVAALKELGALDSAVGVGERLPPALRSAGLAPFAAFGTRRASYQLGRVQLDVDEADFGHGVMEIEVICDGSPSALALARQDIGEAAGLLGAEPLEASRGGKLETYIRRFCPDLLQRLIETQVLDA